MADLLSRDDYINIKEALTRVRDNKKLFRRMLGLFMESGEFANLEDSLMQKDYGKAADAAHAIKGMTGNLSLTELFKISTRMMEELRQGIASEESQADFRAAYSQTRLYVEEVMAEMDGE
ncbi:MAG: Hpt domain-containing protein [Clostridiales bacterium]|nr:Hpt domain-containing protein [Clostridiales bacterium]